MLEKSTNTSNQTESGQTNETVISDNLTESESLEQEGVLVVNVSANNILNLDELYPFIQISNSSNKVDESTNKIQSNSREITGDSNNNIKFKDFTENITVAPAPTNGILSTNEQEEDKSVLTKKVLTLDGNVEANDLLKPTESLQNLLEDSNMKRKHRKRRHGNRKR